MTDNPKKLTDVTPQNPEKYSIVKHIEGVLIFDGDSWQGPIHLKQILRNQEIVERLKEYVDTNKDLTQEEVDFFNELLGLQS